MLIYEDQYLTIFQSSLYKTNSIVVKTDDFVLVVDPTWLPEEVQEIKVYVEEITHNKPLYLLLTHSDFDHILGYGAFPNAKTIGHEMLNKRNDKDRILNQIIEFDDQYYLDRNYEIQYPEIDIEVDRDRKQLNLGSYNLEFYLAPGHTEDGIVTFIKELGFLIVGDYLSDIEFPFIFDSSNHYMNTLKKIEDLLETKKIEMLIPGHGNPTSDSKVMNNRVLDSIHYLEQTKKYAYSSEEELSYDLISEYNYQSNLREMHKANIDLIRKEESR